MLAAGRGGAPAMQGARRTRALGFLFDFADATFTRNYEGADVDPRNGWAFNLPQISDWDDWVSTNTNLVTPEFDTSGGISVTTGQADPFGGITAELLTDNAAGVSEYGVTANAVYSSAPIWLTIAVKKDAAATTFARIVFRQNTSGTLDIRLDPSDGQYEVSAGSPAHITVQEIGGWYWVAVRYAAWVNPGCLIYPAAGTSLPTLAAAATGSVTVAGPWVVDGAEDAPPMPWLSPNNARIYSDDAILVEEARTNFITYSADFASWTNAGSDLTSAQLAPDGSTSAYRLGDSSAAANRYIHTPVTAGATGSHCWSAYFLKDSDTSRFPELLLLAGTAVISGGTVAVQINTQTGATITRSGSPTYVEVSDAGDWWRLVVVVNITTTGTVETRLYGAITTTWGTAEVAATGAVTVWGVQCEASPYVTSPIRTDGATATRSVEVCGVSIDAALEASLEGTWTLPVWPLGDDGYHGAYTRVYQVGGGSAYSLQHRNSAFGFYLLANGTYVVTQSPATAWSKYDELALTTRAPTSGNWELASVNRDTTVTTDQVGTGGANSALNGLVMYFGSSHVGNVNFPAVFGRPYSGEAL